MPLHLLDNLANLTDPASSRNALDLGTGDSPQFASITTSGATISGSLNVTDSVDFNGGVTFQTNLSNFIDLNAPTITSNATIINLNATNIALNATNEITVGAPINSSITLNGSLTASGIVTSPDFSLAGTSGGEFVASKNARGWVFGNKTTPALTSDLSPQGVFFKPDGSIMYILGSNTGATHRVFAHNVPTPWDVSTVSAAATLSSVVIEGAMQGLYFSPDGRYFFTLTQNRTVRRYQMSVGSEWNVSTGVPSGSFTLGVSQTVNRGITFKPDGSKMYVFDDNTNFIYEYNLSPAWDVTTATSGPTVAFPDGTSDLTISSDGTRLIAIATAGTFTQVVFEYTLPTPWSITGAYFNGRMQFVTGSAAFPAGGPAVAETFPTGIYYNDVLNKCFFVGSNVDRVQEIIVTPQPAIVGTRPLILSNQANSVIDRVTINSLQITDTTVSTSTGTGALLVAGGVGVGGTVRIVGNFFADGQIQTAGQIQSIANVQAGSSTTSNTAFLGIAQRSKIWSPVDGIFRITNNAGDSFTRLQFGGIDGNFPAIKRNGTGLDIVLASDAGFTDLKAKQITATGPIIFPSLPYMTVITYTGASYEGAMVFVYDEIGGSCMAYYNGTDWLRIDNNTIIAPAL